MAGPAQRSIRKFVIPPGETQRLYAPGLLAKRVRNLVKTVDGTLRSVRGPAVHEHDAKGDPIVGWPHGLWTGSLLGGIDETIILRIAETLTMFHGDSHFDYTIESGLTNETSPRFPDRFVQFNNRVIWTNGIDRPRVITHDGMVTYLGFDGPPAPLQAQGPMSARSGLGTASTDSMYPNSLGFAWTGRIGTIGDTLAGQTGSLLAGEWIYYVLAESVHGDLSPASLPSNPVRTASISAEPYDADEDATLNFKRHGYELDDLTRQFRLVGGGDHDDNHCVAWRIYRTPDARNAGNQPQFLVRLPGRRKLNYDDAHSDSELGGLMPDLVSVPVFRCMWVHQGCLYIANTPQDPGLVRKSEPGLPGTFSRLSYGYPDGGGMEVTGGASHGGRSVVFTETGVYDCSDIQNPQSLAEGIGCVAPGSIAAHPSGNLIWLGHDGFYSLSPTGQVSLISAGIEQTIFQKISRGSMRLATADINPESGEYICFLSPAGSIKNTLGLAYDGEVWKEYDFGLNVRAMSRTRDRRDYLYMLVRDPRTLETNIYVFDHETPSKTVPDKATARYDSANLYFDEVGLYPAHVHDLYIGLVDCYDGTATIRFYRNGESTPHSDAQTFRLMGTDGYDDASGAGASEFYRDVASRAVVGTSVVHDKRLTWRRVPVNMRNATTWRFQIEVTYPAQIEIASFAFTTSLETSGLATQRLPHKDDT